MELNQEESVLVSLDPTVGSEIRKTFPCVVLSPDEMNTHLRTVTIAPMTTKSHPYPTRINIRHNRKTGWVVLDQIRTIDKLRVIKSLGHSPTRRSEPVRMSSAKYSSISAHPCAIRLSSSQPCRTTRLPRLRPVRRTWPAMFHIDSTSPLPHQREEGMDMLGCL